MIRYVAEIVAYDPSIAGTRTLYYSTVGFSTLPSDTPANTHFDERLKQPGFMRRDLFDLLTTSGRSRVGYGDLVLLNGDGELDALIGYGFDGRALTIRRGEVGAAYPSGFTTMLVGTMEQPEVGRETVTIKLRDRQAELNVPLQATKYAGNNALPAGLEGVETDLKGKPKPRCFGKVLNVPAVLVNTSKLIYQVHDGAIASLDAVYDRGVGLVNGLGAFTEQTPGTGDTINGLAFGTGLFVLVGDNGDLFTSPTGVTWTSRTSQFAASHIYAVGYDATLGFVAVGAAGKISTSTDGITWTAQTSGVAVDLRAVGFHAGLMIAAGASGTLITSPTGVTWTSRSTGLSGSSTIGAIAASDFYVVAGGGGEYAISTNGTSWSVPADSMPSQVNALAYADEVFLAGDGGGHLWRSLDRTGQVFLVVESPFGSTPIRGIAYDASRAIVLAVGDSGKVAWSYDNGVTWSAGVSTLEGVAALNAVTVGSAIFVAAGAGDRLVRAPAENYGSATDLEDDDLAPAPGCVKAYLAGGYFRLGAPPAGLVTADVTQKPLSNVLTDPENLGAWAVTGTPVRTSGQSDPLGGTAAYLLEDDDAVGAERLSGTITFAGSGEKAALIFLKAGTAAASRLTIRDSTAGVVRHGVNVTWAAGVPSLSTSGGAGTLFTPVMIASGWYLIAFTATGIVAGNSHLFDLFPAGATASATGTVSAFGGNAFDDDRPHPYRGPSLNPNGVQTAANLFDAVTELAGKGWADLQAGDLFALDVANDAELGFWTHDEMTCAQVLDLIANSVGAWWGVDRTGLYRIAQFTAPSGTAVQAFVASDMIRPLTRRLPNDATRGLPTWKTIVRWGRVYAVQTTDLAGGVTAAHRALVSKEWREAVATDAAVQTVHLLAPQTVEDSLLTTEADAQAEASRRQTLRGTLRHMFEFSVAHDDETVTLDLGNVVTVTHARYGLSAGDDFRILALEPDPAANRLGLVVWG